MNFMVLQAVSFGVTFAYASYFEWFLHKFFMHRPTLFSYAFRAHTQVHHQVFKADTTYHLQRPEDKWLITFAWWNYPLLLGIHFPALAVLEYYGFHVSIGMVLGMSAYYFMYEYLHFSMHNPAGRFFEKTRLFGFINQNHQIHHKHMNRNLNIVCPLADLTFGTFLRDRQLLALNAASLAPRSGHNLPKSYAPS